MYIHNRNVTADDGPIRSESAVLIAGSVYGQGQIDAGGPIFIRGSVGDAAIRSATGSITVRGEVMGSAPRKAVLQAQGDVTCGNLRNALVQASGDLHLQGRARESTLVIAGNVFVPDSLELGLLDVQLKVGGGLVPQVAVALAPEVTHGERQHLRVARQLEAAVALQRTPPFDFHSCTILDLSPSGAACQLPTAMAAVTPGTLLQLKFVLPESSHMVIAIARVARVIAPDAVGVAFLHMMEHDRQRLASFCMQMVLSRAYGMPGTRNQRGNHDLES